KLIFALNRIAKASGSDSSGSYVAKTETTKVAEKTVGAGGSQTASAKGIGGKQSSDWGEKVPGLEGSKFAQGGKTPGSEGQNSLSGQKRGIGSGKSGDKAEKITDFDEDFGSGGDKIASTKGVGPSNKNAAKWNEKLAQTGKTPQDSSSADTSSGTDKNNMVFEETPAGIRLSVRDIKFKADSADVLPGEKSRLDEIAEVLKLAPNSQFLIEGHTAAVGKPAGEQKLSEERAKNIAAELSKRGIPAANFICKGHGGNKPIASNSTNEGRAQNRRVEITILE
ncbi:MAG: OmpA family protein, partial [Treponema sp.]|nr:OmpA family protein [Treponema sp.]